MNIISADAATPGKFLTLSNLLSLLRIILVVPFVVVILARAPWSGSWGILILALAALTDRYDGILARKYHQETEWGRILDPIADKIGIISAVVVLLIVGSLPLWFVIVIIGRDVLILSGGMYIKARTGKVLPSMPAGKWATGAMSLTLLVILAGLSEPVVQVFIWVAVVMVFVSLGFYVRRFIEVMSTSEAGSADGSS